ncbi:glycosyltransferase family 71 protein [Suhomyces tanzawaensis NRRL Y-17324]|uniref:Glycosyltransferase family 71 protein n=1 Tax=Suhomyces tanzawaensis NRRL Y-17324 TaxID=984487 RepID=A0A1E4SRW5_9ASCO|nr:glycosyltransferase family 71 protein [Suhomyces tanzawaensis NRRL Y-17324]ODV82167.1 glycosyltransferase family 71 protein [Suhomyces tanzawaensis NRRL Y-17324]
MSPLRKFARDRSLIAVVVLLVCGIAVVLTHRTPSPISHEAITRHILNNINPDLVASSPEPIEYIQSQIETYYTRKLFRSIEDHVHLQEAIKADYASHNHEQLVNEIVREVSQDPQVAELPELVQKVESALNHRYSKKAYYDDILEHLILHNAPQCPAVDRVDSIFGYSYNYVGSPCFSKSYITSLGKTLPESSFHELQKKHDNLVRALRDLPEPPKSFVHGDGIVINGGGAYLMGALTVVAQIREMGSVLPVEVVLAYHSEYDDHICETLLPRLNGSCVVVESAIGASLLKKLKLKRFQLKILGLLVSSFDNIIALDADNFPIQNVDKLLESEVYLKNKFILWPDLWHKATSPSYYDIARFKLGEPNRRQGLQNSDSYTDYIQRNRDTDILLHDLEGAPPAMGAETGQMVFSKRAHYRSFLLALYYNVYGYSHYYELLFQGVFGEGDRETFIPALHVMNEPYYLVTRDAWLAGYQDGEDNFQESTIVQYSPQETEDFFDDWRDWLFSKGLDSRLWPYQDNDYTRELFSNYKSDRGDKARIPSVMFLHVHNPKINAAINAQKKTKTSDQIYTRRSLGLPGRYPCFGETDWELKFHSISKWLACDALSGKHFWKHISKLPQKKVCEAVSKYVDFLKRDSPNVGSAKLDFLSIIEGVDQNN